MLGKALTTAAAGNAAGEGLYVEEVFSTYLFDSSNSISPVTVTNGIDLASEGGMVWVKSRTNAGANPTQNNISDTERGTGNKLITNGTYANIVTQYENCSSFNSDGFAYEDGFGDSTNKASWTFRKAPKFFDVVTYTGTGSATTIPHNLGSVPGCIIVKSTTYALGWPVYHRSLGQYTNTLYLNDTSAAGASKWNEQLPTDSSFPISANDYVNKSGETYVAYLFAHNDGDGEFGEDADQDIIKCGSIDLNSGSDTEVDLGFEPQWLLYKVTNTSGENWRILDNMRGGTADSGDTYLNANTADAESTANVGFKFTSTGFIKTNEGVNLDYIYIAIRRGPMKTPESGTEVFAIDQGSTERFYSGFPVDFFLRKDQSGSGSFVYTRLAGENFLQFDSTNTESSSTPEFDDMLGVERSWSNTQTDNYAWMFRRAPGFFDVVAYTGNGTAGRTVSHNLGVAPEFMFVKCRDGAYAWVVQLSEFGGTHWTQINGTTSIQGSNTTFWNGTTANASTFTLGSSVVTNGFNLNYIAYLFATVPGVSKVGSYTGNGTSQTIDCGFSTGARFVMTKRTNETGNWNVWDSERGIVAGNDPRLELNTTDAEDTGHDYIDPDNSGFVVNYVADDNDDSNVSGDEYIFLAIA